MNTSFLAGLGAVALTLAACTSWAAATPAPVNICGTPVHHIDVEDGHYDPHASLYPDESDPNVASWRNMHTQTTNNITIWCYDSATAEPRKVPLPANLNNCSLGADDNMLCTQ